MSEDSYERSVSKLMLDPDFKKAVEAQIDQLKEEGYETRQRPFSEYGTAAAAVVKARSTYGIDAERRPDLHEDLDKISKLYDKIISGGSLKKRKKSNKRKKTNQRKKSKTSKKSKPTKKSKPSRKSKPTKNSKSKKRSRRRRN